MKTTAILNRLRSLKILRSLLIIISLLLALAFLLPLPEQLLSTSALPSQQILDRNGKLLYEVRHPEYGSQEYLSYESIPEKVIEALISIEDRRFHSHRGVSPSSVLRALWQNFQAGKIVSGGSTITQQLVRNRLQPEHRGYVYKTYEMVLALKLETRLSKEDILEAYLNSAYFGQQAYGLKAAALTFFDKTPAELSTAESALLVGLLQSPSRYNPHQQFKLAKARQEQVLLAMKETGQISAEEYETALTEPIQIADARVDIKAPHFVFWVLSQLPEVRMESSPKKEMATRQITTTLDLNLQTEIENIVTNELTKLADKNVSSAAVVVLDVDTGEVLSMVGSADYFDTQHDGQVNVALSSRQPGSALKPFTYALALAQGDTAASTVADIEAQFFTQEGNPYIPRNYDYGFHGLVRYREALANSYNIPAVKVLEKVGVAKLQDFLRSAGITTLTQDPEFYGVALTLGSGEVRLLELTQAYGIFPRGGRTLPVQYLLEETPYPLSLTLSQREKGLPSLRPSPTPASQILDPKIAWLVTDILSDNQARIPEFGEDSPLFFGDRPVAAKTGTTRNSRDNWTIGFSPDYLVGVWVGNADNSPMINTSGITGAGPIFHAVMEAVTRNTPPKAFERPPGLVRKEVCKLSGQLPTRHCPHTIQEWFIAGTEPRIEDQLYQPVHVDSRNGLLASETCPSEFIQEQVFIQFPPELQKWSRENGYASPPTAASPLCRSKLSVESLEFSDTQPSTLNTQPISITKPHQGDSFQLDPLIPDEDEKIILEARADASIQELTWFINGQAIGTAKAPDFRFEWEPMAGPIQVSAQAEGVSDSVRMYVEE